MTSLDGRAWFNPEWVDAGLAADTEAMLRSLEVDVLFPGHGPPNRITHNPPEIPSQLPG